MFRGGRGYISAHLCYFYGVGATSILPCSYDFCGVLVLFLRCTADVHMQYVLVHCFFPLSVSWLGVACPGLAWPGLARRCTRRREPDEMIAGVVGCQGGCAERSRGMLCGIVVGSDRYRSRAVLFCPFNPST